MSEGNPDLAAVWGGADVLVGPVTAVIPTGPDFGINRTVTIGTTNADATITFASGALTAADVGLSISGTGIPASTTVLSITNATTAELSANATATGASVSAAVGATNGWKFVGLLDPGQGFTEGIEQSSTDHSAWGRGVIATTYSAKKTTKTFTALEDNETVLSLVYEVDDLTIDDVAGTYSGDLGVRDDTERVRIAFKVTSGSTARWQASKNYATVTATDAGSESEESLGTKGFEATIVPDENNKLWTVYKGAA